MDAAWNQLAWTHLWQVSALAVFVAVVVRGTGRTRPRLAHGLWLLVVAKSLTPPIWASPVGVFCWLPAWETPVAREEAASARAGTLGDAWRAATDATRATRATGASAVAASPGESVASAPRDVTSAGEAAPAEDVIEWSAEVDVASVAGDAAVHGESAREGRRAAGWAAASEAFASWWAIGWLAGVFAFAAAAVWKWERYRRQWSDVDEAATEAVQRSVDRLARRLGLRRPVRAVVTRSNLGPAVVGVWRPRVIVPRALLTARPEDAATDDAPLAPERLAALEPILAHELLHVRRGDLWLGWLQVVSRSVWWFHPLVAWANRAAAREAERCCDAEVVSELGCPPSEYARSLLDVLERKRWLRSVAPFPGVRPVEVTTRRLESIMRWEQGSRSRMAWWARGLCALALLATLPGASHLGAGQKKGRGARDATPAETPVVESNRSIARTYELRDLLDRLVREEFAAGDRAMARDEFGRRIDALARPPGVGAAAEVSKRWKGDRLVVRAAPDEHERIASRIELWRRHGWPQIQTETRIVAGASRKFDDWKLAWNLVPVARPARDERRALAVGGGESTETIVRRVPLRYAVLPNARIDELLQDAAAQQFEVLAHPRVVQFSGLPSEITCQTQRAFETWGLDATGAATMRPEFTPEGWSLVLEPEATDEDRVRLSMAAVFSQIRRVERVEFTPGAEGTKDARPPVTLEIPEVAALRFSLQASLAGDHSLVVRGLSGDTKDAARERLLIVRCRKVTPDELRVAPPPAAALKAEGETPTQDLPRRADATAAEARRRELRAYAVRDLLPAKPTPTGPLVIAPDGRPAGPVAGTTTRPTAPASRREGAVRGQKLVAQVQEHVRPESWRSVGGIGEIAFDVESSSLIVRHDPDVQEAVAEWLDAHRRREHLQVALRIVSLTADAGRLDTLRWPAPRRREGLETRRPDGIDRALLTAEEGKELERSWAAASAGDATKRWVRVEMPRVTAFSGQTCELEMEDDARSTGLKLDVVPEVSEDRRYVKLGVALAAVDEQGARVASYVGQAPDGGWVALRLRRTGNRAVQGPASRETVLLVQPTVVEVDDEEEAAVEGAGARLPTPGC